MKIRKYQMLAFLKIFEKLNCKTIKDIKELLDHDLKNDTDVVFKWNINATKKDFEIK